MRTAPPKKMPGITIARRSSVEAAAGIPAIPSARRAMARRKLSACMRSREAGEDDSWIALVTNHLFLGNRPSLLKGLSCCQPLEP